MGWRQLYEQHADNTARFANADLHNGSIAQTSSPPRLLAYPWMDGEDPMVKMELLPARDISRAFGTAIDLHAVVDPTFQSNFISRILAEKVRPGFQAGITLTYFDVFGHTIPVLGEIEAIPLFWGDDPSGIGELAPSIYDSIGAVSWGILPDTVMPHSDFVLIGRRLMNRLVTVFSRGWTLIGLDDGNRH